MNGSRRPALPYSPTNVCPARHVIASNPLPPPPPTSMLHVSGARGCSHQENGRPIPHTHGLVPLTTVLMALTTAPSETRKPATSTSFFLRPFDDASSVSAGIDCPLANVPRRLRPVRSVVLSHLRRGKEP